METFFQDPGEERLAPENVRIRRLSAQPWLDRQIVHVTVEVDPFQQRPNLDLAVFDAQGNELASTSIIQSMARKMEVNLHLRAAPRGETCTLTAALYSLSLEGESNPDQEPGALERLERDTARITFELS